MVSNQERVIVVRVWYMQLFTTFIPIVSRLAALGLPVATTNNNKVVLTPKEYEKAVQWIQRHFYGPWWSEEPTVYVEIKTQTATGDSPIVMG